MVVEGATGVGLLMQSAVSVTAFDADELQALGVTDVADLGAVTPNLQIVTAGSTTPIFFIRGVGLNDFTANASGAVAVYQDDVPLNLPAFTSGPLYDIEDVVVLLGPQGSGPGRNASAGAIRSTSRKPTGEFDAFLRTEYGNYDAKTFEGAVGFPILGDELAARFAFKVDQREGFMTNTGVIGGPGLPKNMNNVDRWAARGMLRYRPANTELDFLLNVHGVRVDQLGTVGQPLGAQRFLGSATTQEAYQAPEVAAELTEYQTAEWDKDGVNIPLGVCRRTPGCLALRDAGTVRAQDRLARELASGRPLDKKPFVGDYNLPGHERQETWGASLRGEATVGTISFVSVTGFERYQRSRMLDFDFTPRTIFEFDIKDDAWQVTEDIRLEQTLDVTPLTWRAGGFFLAEELDYDQLTIAGGQVRPLVQIFTQSTYGFGIYSEFEWRFTDDFELLAGVRYNWEYKEFDIEAINLSPSQNLCEVGFGTIGNPSAVIPPCKTQATFSDPTGVVSLTYDFDESRSAYLKYSRGWKGPQYNVSNGSTRDAFTLAKPETIDAVETGFHGGFWDDRIKLKGALFLYRYANYQVFVFTNDSNAPPQRIVRNANSARLYGAELETDVEPIDRLELNVRFAWLESKFLDFKDSGIRRIPIAPTEPPLITEVPIDFTGNRLPNTPRFEVNGSIQYSFESERLGALIPRYEFRFMDDVTFDPSNGRGAPDNLGNIFLPKHTIGQKARILHNMQLTYRAPGESIELAFWIRNLTNEVYKTLAFDTSAVAGLVGNLVGLPRTYGLAVKFDF
ncbi:MAG: TonB-dependent receptor [Spirochaetaceae bacterium]|nr:TonB-dependent receptor [Spirochaetaceae bacterium]